MVDTGACRRQAFSDANTQAAARVAVLDPIGAVFRYDNEEVGVHWAMPGGGPEPGEAPLRAGSR